MIARRKLFTLSTLSLQVLALLLCLSQAGANSTTTNIYYMWNDTQTLYSSTLYVMNETAPSGAYKAWGGEAQTGDLWGACGFRIYVLGSDGSSELTSGSPVAIVNKTSGETGLSTVEVTASLSYRKLHYGYQAFKLVCYTTYEGSGVWTNRGQLSTELLDYASIPAQDLTLYITVNRTVSGGNTYFSVAFGNSTAPSRISLELEEGDVIDQQTEYLQRGYFLNFLVAGYTYQIGNLFYALLVSAFGITLYIRFRSLNMLIVFMLIFGGAGGVFNLAIGELFAGVVWIFATFAIGAVIYGVFR